MSKKSKAKKKSEASIVEGFGKSGDAWQISVEWDGEIPNAAFRNRIFQIAGVQARGNRHSLTLKADGTKVGVYMPQECVIFCTSYSLARTLYFIAKEGYLGVSKEERKFAEAEGREPREQMIYPTRVVMAPVVGVMDDLEMTAADEANLKRIKEQLGKPGRKPAAKTFTVTCYEEGLTHECEAPMITGCPVCHGQHFRDRQGHHFSFAMDEDDTLGNAWVRSRFSSGQMEFPNPNPKSQTVAKALKDVQAGMRIREEKAFCKALLKADGLLKQLEETFGRDDDEAAKFLDSLAISMVNFSPARRNEARVRGVTEFFKMGGTMPPLSIEETKGHIDIMCAAHYVETRPDGAARIAKMMMAMAQDS